MRQTARLRPNAAIRSGWLLGILAASSSFLGWMPIGARGDEPGLVIQIAERGWGEAKPATVGRVLQEAAYPLLAQLPGRKFPPLFVEPRGGPIVLYQRGEAGRIRVKLNTGDLYWSQYIYQFAHELCHVICEYDEDPHGNDWFEESLCEMASLYALRQLGTKWKTDPPFAHWRDYARHLTDYAEDRLKKSTLPEGISLRQWYHEHAQQLHQTSTERALNGVIAGALLPRFEEHPRYWTSVQYINRSRPSGPIPFSTFLQQWHAATPPEQRDSVEAVAAEFGIDPRS